MKCCVDSGRQDVKMNFVAVMKDLLGPMPTWIMQPFIAHCINNNTPQNGLALLKVTCRPKATRLQHLVLCHVRMCACMHGLPLCVVIMNSHTASV